MEGLGIGIGGCNSVSFQGQKTILIKDCVHPSGGAQEIDSRLSAHENPHSRVVATVSASLVASLVTICQAGAVKGSTGLECPLRPAADPVGPPMHRM